LLVSDARNHYPQNKHHTPPPSVRRQHTHPHKKGANTGLLPQDPTVCPACAGQHHPRRGRTGWWSPLLLFVHSSAPPATHYRRRQKISQPQHPHPCEVRGNHGAP
jgi:hypothetical protein